MCQRMRDEFLTVHYLVSSFVLRRSSMLLVPPRRPTVYASTSQLKGHESVKLQHRSPVPERYQQTVDDRSKIKPLNDPVRPDEAGKQYIRAARAMLLH